MNKVTKDNSKLFGLISRYIMCTIDEPNTSLVDYYSYEFSGLFNTYQIRVHYVDNSRLDITVNKYSVLGDELNKELQKEEE